MIGQFGVGGEAASHPKHLRFKEAQIAPASLPEFEGNVAVVRTDAHWDTEAQEIFDRGWKENLEEWNKVGSDRPYHYLGPTMLGIGEAFGEAVLELNRAAPKRKMKKKRRRRRRPLAVGRSVRRGRQATGDGRRVPSGPGACAAPRPDPPARPRPWQLHVVDAPALLIQRLEGGDEREGARQLESKRPSGSPWTLPE